MGPCAVEMRDVRPGGSKQARRCVTHWWLLPVAGTALVFWSGSMSPVGYRLLHHRLWMLFFHCYIQGAVVQNKNERVLGSGVVVWTLHTEVCRFKPPLAEGAQNQGLLLLLRLIIYSYSLQSLIYVKHGGAAQNHIVMTYAHLRIHNGGVYMDRV